MNSTTSADFWLSVFASVVGSLLYTALIAAVAVLITLVVVRRERQRLFDLLAIEPEAPVLRILLSRMEILHGGSKGADGKTAVGFTGPALMQMEYIGAIALEQLVAGRFLQVLPAFLQRLVQRRSSSTSRPRVEIDVAPDEHSYASILQGGTEATVLLGSDVYSHAVRAIYESPRSLVRFVCEATDERFDASQAAHGDPTFAVRTDESWLTIPARSIGRELGVIQRVTLGSGRRITMCAGISSSSTCGATMHLCRYWRDLCARFGGDDFLVVLAFRNQQPDGRLVQEPEELRDFERRRPSSPALAHV